MLKKIVSLLIVLSLCAGAALAAEEWEPFPMSYFDQFGFTIDDWTVSPESRALAAAMMLDAYWLSEGGSEDDWEALSETAVSRDAVLTVMEGELCPMLVCYYPNAQDYFSLCAYFREDEPDIECFVKSDFTSKEEIIEYHDVGMDPCWVIPQADLAAALGQ